MIWDFMEKLGEMISWCFFILATVLMFTDGNDTLCIVLYSVSLLGGCIWRASTFTKSKLSVVVEILNKKAQENKE